MTNAPHIGHALSKRCPNDGVWRRKDLRAVRFRGPGGTGVEPERIKRRVTINLETRRVIEDVRTGGDPRFEWRRALPGGRQNIETTYHYEPDPRQVHKHQALHSGRAGPAQEYTKSLCRHICLGIQEQMKADQAGHPMMIGAVEVEDNVGRRLRQLKEARSDVQNMEGDGQDQDGGGEEDWTTAWDDVKDRELDPRRVVQA